MRLIFAIINFILAGICIYQASDNKESVRGQLSLCIFLVINGILVLT